MLPPLQTGAAPINLPDMGDPSATVLSPREERLLGQAFMRNIRRSLPLIEDVEVHSYINALGYRLLANTDTDRTGFSFFVVDAPSINAFAGPGGYIGIHSGLILEAKNEGELAAVVAHEIAHVTQHHLSRSFQKAAKSNLQTTAAILAAIILSSIDPNAASAAIVAATAGNIQQQLNFTRAHEKEADWLGIDILAKGGYDPHHMAAFFKRLEEATRFSDSSAIPELLQTHPVTANRISDAQNRALRYPPISDHPLPSFDYVQAKLRARTKHMQPDYVAQIRKKARQTDSDNNLIRYEYALVLLYNNQLKEALTISRELLDQEPEKINNIALQAEIDYTLGRYTDAEPLLTKALGLYPKHPWLTMLYAKTLIADKKPQQASQQLRTLITEQARFALPSYYHLLAKAQQQAGALIDSALSLAEYYYQTGQTHSAISQLEKALDTSDKVDSYNRQRLEAKLEFLKEQALLEKEIEKH